MTDARRVAVALIEGAEMLDVTGPAEVLTTATRLLATEGRPGYH